MVIWLYCEYEDNENLRKYQMNTYRIPINDKCESAAAQWKFIHKWIRDIDHNNKFQILKSLMKYWYQIEINLNKYSRFRYHSKFLRYYREEFVETRTNIEAYSMKEIL